MQIVLFEKIRWIRLFNTSIKGNFKHINMQCARNINHTLLLKMTVVSEQMTMLWFYFIITMVEISSIFFPKQRACSQASKDQEPGKIDDREASKQHFFRRGSRGGEMGEFSPPFF